MAKSDNLLAILWMLGSRERMTAAQIARELEVDVRTVYRYIDALSASGAPIIAEPGPNGGYGLLDSFRDTPLFFSAAERVALEHAGLFARQAGYPYTRDLQEALRKIERHLTAEQIDQLQHEASLIDVIGESDEAQTIAGSQDKEAPGRTPERAAPRGDAPPEESVKRLKVIEDAIAGRTRMKILHARDAASEPLAREVDPYGLIYWHDNWYLVGYCHLRKDIRMFRCDRILSAKSTSGVFEPPPGFSARGHFLRTMLPKDAVTEEVTIRVRGTPFAVESLSHHWFLRNFVRERTERTLSFAVDLDHADDYLPYLVLSYAGEMEVLEPEELRRKIAGFARKIAEAHGDER
ncbi:MAG TPA: YafY family protein [Spirochaetia bacterium]|nr:YafY family protein [Spirochaetia bacterium]